MEKMKNKSRIIIPIMALFMVTGCAQSTFGDETKLNVITSFNAMSELCIAIGGDKINLLTIIPTGTEPHDFEPTITDVVNLSKADIFVINGLNMETWAEELINTADNDNLILCVASENSVARINTDENETSEHGQYDPHMWLSLNKAQEMAATIAGYFYTSDPVNATYYEANLDNFNNSLEELANEYVDKFASVANKDFVTGHAAFGYLCDEYGLEQNSIEDMFAEGEPTTAQLASLVEYCRTNNVSTIFSEMLSSQEISTTLASEVDAEVVQIYTIESAENNMSYYERMEYNLEKIYQSLK